MSSVSPGSGRRGRQLRYPVGVNVRLPESAVAFLTRYAEGRDSTASTIARRLVLEGIERLQQQPPEPVR